MFCYLTLFDTAESISEAKTSDTNKEEIKIIEEEVNEENSKITEHPQETIIETINQTETVFNHNLTRKQSLNIFNQSRPHLLKKKN